VELDICAEHGPGADLGLIRILHSMDWTCCVGEESTVVRLAGEGKVSTLARTRPWEEVIWITHCRQRLDRAVFWDACLIDQTRFVHLPPNYCSRPRFS
jgi:hypothetical protein